MTALLLHAGPHRRDSVRQQFTDRDLGPPVDAEAWQRLLAEAEASGRDLYDAPMVRLNGMRVQAGTLVLDYGRTSYAAYASTRAAAGIREPFRGNADPIGTLTLVTTADGFVPLGKRSERADINAGRLFCFGGMFDLADCDPATGLPDAFFSAARELHEESGLQADPGRLELLAVLYDQVHPHANLAFHVSLPETRDAFRPEHWQRELNELQFVPRDRLRDFAEQNAALLSDNLRAVIPLIG